MSVNSSPLRSASYHEILPPNCPVAAALSQVPRPRDMCPRTWLQSFPLWAFPPPCPFRSSQPAWAALSASSLVFLPLISVLVQPASTSQTCNMHRLHGYDRRMGPRTEKSRFLCGSQSSSVRAESMFSASLLAHSQFLARSTYFIIGNPGSGLPSALPLLFAWQIPTHPSKLS